MAETSIRTYFAAPLFNQQERLWNRRFSEVLREVMPELDITLPQDFRVNNRYNDPEHYGDIFRLCVENMRNARLVVAILDGADADSGVAFECGVAYSLGKPVIGVRTDYREGAERGVNIMLANGCTHIVREFAFLENPRQLAEHVARRIRKILEETPETR